MDMKHFLFLGMLVGFCLPVLAGAVLEDFSTPKKCVLSYFDVLENGAPEELNACIAPAGAGETDNVYFSGDDHYIWFWERAIRDKFGPDSIPINLDQEIAHIKELCILKGVVTTSGNTATVSMPNSKLKFVLVKTKAGWKFSRTGNPEMLQAGDRGKILCEQMTKVIGEIRQGKYPTSEEAMKAVGDALQSVQNLEAKASTRPAK